jgi:hypothetical protein
VRLLGLGNEAIDPVMAGAYAWYSTATARQQHGMHAHPTVRATGPCRPVGTARQTTPTERANKHRKPVIHSQWNYGELFAEVLQRRPGQTLPFAEFEAIYLDDVCIFSNTIEDHLIHIRAVLSRLRDYKLYAKP